MTLDENTLLMAIDIVTQSYRKCHVTHIEREIAPFHKQEDEHLTFDVDIGHSSPEYSANYVTNS